MRDRRRSDGSGGVRWFGALGRWVVRHPWHPILFWVALLVVAVPFLPLLGSVTTNSATSLPSNSPSAVASAELARLFPNTTGGSSSIVLLYGTNLTDANGQRVVMNVTSAIASDRSLADILSVADVYTEYSAYLAGQAELAGGVLTSALAPPAPLPAGINASASLLWGPPSLFLQNFRSLVANGTPTSQAGYPAFVTTNASLASGAARVVLAAFYPAFNVTFTCFANPATLVPCADGAARTALAPLLPSLFTTNETPLASAVLAGLGIENATAWSSIRSVGAGVLAATSGLSDAFLLLVWQAFPTGTVLPAAAGAWANATVARATLATEPLPVPRAILDSFVNPSGTASIVSVTFSVADDAVNASGGQPVYSDLNRISVLVGPVVAAHDPTRAVRWAQTGPSALDLLTQTSINSSIALVLPITVGLLLAIAMIYFRSPITPLVTFAALGIALVLGLGATVLIGTLVGHVDTTSITLEEVFVLGVGTDYSIFLTARYREELLEGRSSEEAIVASVSWAGQSVATSGSTAIIATLALAFSGVALLSQWGSVLSLAILIAVLISLTVIPAALRLIGPRIFWPMTGNRFDRHALRLGQRRREESTYFYRVGRATQRRPLLVVGIVLLVSVPLVAVALNASLSYDFYAQLPTNQPATQGLATLGSEFGAGFAVPSFALVTFAAPLVTAGGVNGSEFVDLAALTSAANATPGIASVTSPVGVYGAPLGTWLNLSKLPPAQETNLLGTLSGYVGEDHRTVLLNLVPTATGLSEAAVSAVRGVSNAFATYAAGHPAIVAVQYGGGAPVIDDLSSQTATATEFLILAVTVGLIGVLLLVLRSWIIALMAVATIGLSITWAWALTDLIFQRLLGFPLFFYVRTLLIMLVLGLGIDYNIFVLTRVREERLRGRNSGAAAVEAVARTGGIITAAAVILATAFAALLVGSFTLIRAIGFSVAVAVILDAMVVRTYLVPATLQLFGDRIWSATGGRRRRPSSPTAVDATAGTEDPAGRPRRG